MRRRRLGLEGRVLCTLAECDRDRAAPRARGRGKGRRGEERRAEMRNQQ